MHEPTRHFELLALHAASVCAAVVIAACASTPAPAPQYPPAPTAAVSQAEPSAASFGPAPCPRATALDPAQLAAEAACLLAQYVRIDTTNPPGNELATAHFLKDVLARDGIEAQILEPAPGRANLIARLPGTGGGKAVALAHHMDVVPATTSEWSVPPFEAITQDGYLMGRGSLDNKGGGIMGVLTMLMAKRLGTPFPRELVLLALADEEAGSALGSRFITAQHPEWLDNIDFVLNEGGYGATGYLGVERPLFGISMAEKSPLWLTLRATGRPGHGSAPHEDNVLDRLVKE